MVGRPTPDSWVGHGRARRRGPPPGRGHPGHGQPSGTGARPGARPGGGPRGGPRGRGRRRPGPSLGGGSGRAPTRARRTDHGRARRGHPSPSVRGAARRPALRRPPGGDQGHGRRRPRARPSTSPGRPATAPTTRTTQPTRAGSAPAARATQPTRTVSAPAGGAAQPTRAGSAPAGSLDRLTVVENGGATLVGLGLAGVILMAGVVAVDVGALVSARGGADGGRHGGAGRPHARGPVRPGSPRAS